MRGSCAPGAGSYWAAGLQLLDPIRLGDEDCNYNNAKSDRELFSTCVHDLYKL